MNSRARAEDLIIPLLIRVGSGADDSLTGGAGDDQLFGFAGNDTLRGAGGNDWIEPGSGNDLVDGGTGASDLVNYSDDTDDIAITRGLNLNLATGTAIDGWNDTDTLVGIEQAIGTTRADRMTGNGGANAFAGRAGSDTLIGGGGGDWLQPGSGDDTVDGGAGYDTLVYESDPDDPGATQGVRVDLGSGKATDGWNDTDTVTGIEAVVGSSRADRITGNALDNDLQGGNGDDTLLGAGGDDWLVPGRGNDSVNGGTGNDALSYAGGPEPAQGVVVDLDAGTAVDAWGGTESIGAIEIVLGTALADRLIASDNGGSDLEGRAGNDTLLGGAADDWLQPGHGVDSIDGGAGDDTVSYVEDDGQLADHGVVVDLAKGIATDGWGSADKLLSIENAVGSRQDDTLTGIGENSTLDGRAGNDVFANGEPVYESDPAAVFVNLSFAAASRNGVTVAARTARDGYGDTDTLGNGVISGYGSAHDDVWISSGKDVFVIARAGDDWIRTGTGYDWLQPGSGNDTVDGGAASDGVSYEDDGYDQAGAATRGAVVNLTAGTATDNWGGSDVLISIEDVYGSKLADQLTGNVVSNYLEGGEGNDTLRGQDGGDFIVGGEGNDLVYGGTGTDFYGVTGASMADYIITENTDGSKTVTDNNLADGNDGTDTLFGVEYVGLARIGTDDDDQIVSDSAEAILAIGGNGDDVYVLTQAEDHVVERSGQGTDTVQATISRALEPNVENLVLTGIADLRGTGNDADNVLSGNTGDNALDGAAGADTMSGNVGDDTYYVDDPDDLVIEGASTALLLRPGHPAGGGSNIDTVISQVTYTLRTNVENLQLAGSTDIDGIGNSLNNIMSGNGADNTIKGLGGADILDGGAGRDTLDGGAGSDTIGGGAGVDNFMFRIAPAASGNLDRLLDFSAGTDKLALDDDAFTVFDAGVSTALAPAQFRASASSVAHDATDRIIYNTSTGALFYDADGAGGVAAIKFAQLVGNPVLTAGDFLITG